MFLYLIERTILKLKPVLILSPVFNSDIATDPPFSTFTLATDGKQPPPDGGGGGGGVSTNSKYCMLFG